MTTMTRMTRRRLLQYGAAGGATLLLPWRLAVEPALAEAMPSSPNLTKYLDPLPIPPVLDLRGGGSPTIAMAQGTHQFHAQLPGPATTWGYGGAAYLGPTIEAQKDVPITVSWVNNLPTNGHLFPVDFGIQWANPTNLPPDSPPGTAFPVPAVPHVHGGLTLPQFDGHPEQWWTHGHGHSGDHYVTDTFTYGNNQRAASVWYHDHALGITRLNVYAGLAGYYWIRDEFDTGEAAPPAPGLNLPAGDYEVPLVLQDKIFNADGTLFYPVQDEVAEGTPPVWLPEFFGDTAVVNGKAYPFLEVEPRRYRLRIVNGSDARFYDLKFVDGARVIPFHQIGNEGGFLPAPVQLNTVLIAPGERADIIIDFSGLRRATVLLKNNAKAPFPNGRGGQVNQLVQFRVTRQLQGSDTTTPPAQLVLPPITQLGTPSTARDMLLEERLDAEDDPIVLLVEHKYWHEPVSTFVTNGQTEDWLLINTTGDTHPIHLHLVTFEVKDRRPFDVAAYVPGGSIPYTGRPVPPAPYELGRKDTVRANPGEVTRIRVRFDLPTYGPIVLPPGILNPQYVWHCHILEHEDNEMMRPYEVVGWQ